MKHPRRDGWQSALALLRPDSEARGSRARRSTQTVTTPDREAIVMSRPDSYPRARPYRPPPEIALAPVPLPPPLLPTPTLRRSRLVLVVGVCSLGLTIALVGGVLVLARNARPREGAETRKNNGKDDRLTRIPRKTLSAGKPVKVPEAVAEALGSLTAAHLYQTHLNLGLLADAVEGEVYAKAEALKMLDTVASLMTAIEEQLERVARQPRKATEKKVVEQARQIMGHLRAQDRELRSHWNTGRKDHVVRFHKAQEEAWTGIKALLNLQD